MNNPIQCPMCPTFFRAGMGSIPEEEIPLVAPGCICQACQSSIDWVLHKRPSGPAIGRPLIGGAAARESFDVEGDHLWDRVTGALYIPEQRVHQPPVKLWAP